jgi:hypothetical protein
MVHINQCLCDNWNICESGVKHHNRNPQNDMVITKYSLPLQTDQSVLIQNNDNRVCNFTNISVISL